MSIKVVGIDLAKNVFQICVINKHAELVSNKIVGRQKLKEILSNAAMQIGLKYRKPKNEEQQQLIAA